MKRALLMASMLLIPRLLIAQELDVDGLLGQDWYGLYFNGKKAGYAVTTLEKDDEGNVTSREDCSFRINMVGVPQEMELHVARVYGPGGGLKSITYDVSDTHIEATVRGEKLILVTTVAGQTQTEEVPKPDESLADAVEHAQWVKGKPAEGDTMTFVEYDPLNRTEITGHSTIVGMEDRVLDGVITRVYRIETRFDIMNLTKVSYVTQDGTTLEDVVSGVLTMRLEPEDVAKDVNYSNDTIVSNAALIDAPIQDARTRPTLRLALRGPMDDMHRFNDGRQTMRETDQGYVLFESRRRKADTIQHATLPVKDPELLQWVKPTVLVQSDNEKIVAKAREIVGDETDPVKMSRLLCNWVYDHMHTAFSARLSNSLEVLNSLEGDCTEYSTLFIGLVRSLGIPAREVGGLIYVGTTPGFYYHQWAKVWVGEWIDVDPTFNQPLVDVTHIKLVEGDQLQMAKLIPIIGKLKVEVLPDEPSPGAADTP